MHLSFKKCKRSLLMKISLLAIIFTLAATFSVYSSAAQNLSEIRASLGSESVSLREALRELQHQTGIRFSYLSRDVNQLKSIQVSPQSDNLDAIINDLLAGTGLTYMQVAKTVVKKRRTSPTNDATASGGNRTRTQE